MSMTDPIADLLTRIRNGQMAKHASVDAPASRMKLSRVRAAAAPVSGSRAALRIPDRTYAP